MFQDQGLSYAAKWKESKDCSQETPNSPPPTPAQLLKWQINHVKFCRTITHIELGIRVGSTINFWWSLNNLYVCGLLIEPLCHLEARLYDVIKRARPRKTNRPFWMISSTKNFVWFKPTKEVKKWVWMGLSIQPHSSRAPCPCHLSMDIHQLSFFKAPKLSMYISKKFKEEYKHQSPCSAIR